MDSRICACFLLPLLDSKICDDKLAFQVVGAGIYLGDNEQAHRVESLIYRAKLNPTRKVDSSVNTALAM